MPGAPMSPLSPFGPLGPTSPFGPCAAADSWPALKSAAVSEPFLTLRPLTASFLSWTAPTEFFGRTSLPAAWPSGVAKRTETSSAVVARTMEIFEPDIVLLLRVEFMTPRSQPRQPRKMRPAGVWRCGWPYHDEGAARRGPFTLRCVRARRCLRAQALSYAQAEVRVTVLEVIGI